MLGAVVALCAAVAFVLVWILVSERMGWPVRRKRRRSARDDLP